MRPGVAAEAVLAAVREVAGSRPVRCLATIDRRAGESGFAAAARALDVPIVSFRADELAAVPVTDASTRTHAALGTSSVAEAAAILASGHGPVVAPKRVIAGVTVAAATADR
jgi:cobalt-precorrin 5A hydrolase